MTFEAGDIVRPGKHDIQTLPISASVVVTKGLFYLPGVTGNLAVFDDADITVNGVVMALESADNSSGSAGDKEVQVAGPGSYVVAEMGAGVRPTGFVKIDSSDQLVAATAADLAAGRVLGRFIKQAGANKGTISVAGELGVVLLGAL